VLNDREVKFTKNDDVRVRAICKRKCGFLILCNKVGGSQTFQSRPCLIPIIVAEFLLTRMQTRNGFPKL